MRTILSLSTLLLIPLVDAQTIVTTLDDEDDGAASLSDTSDISLREAIIYSSDAETITFDPSLDGGTITLSEGQLEVSAGKTLSISAEALTNGLTIDAAATLMELRRVLFIDENANVTLQNLTLTGGNPGAGISDFGGGIFASSGSQLTLNSSTISNNLTGRSGGGIFVDDESQLILNFSTITNNSTGSGGSGGGILADIDTQITLNFSTISNNFTGDGVNGIFSPIGNGGGIFASRGSQVTLNTSTISSNFTGDGGLGGLGGGIFASTDSQFTLNSSTISNNSSGDNNGGGISITGALEVTVENSIIAGNTGANGDVNGTIDNILGNNLIGDSGILLAPLGDYGGPTQTMPPLPGSPAVNAALSSILTEDQRGFLITDGMPDIGAVEIQASDLATILDLLFDEDLDQDGSSVGLELAIGTDPFSPDAGAAANLRLIAFNNGQASLAFGVNTNQEDNIILRLVRSIDLINFDEVIVSNQDIDFDLNGAELLEIDDDTAPLGKAFYRLEAERR